MNKSDGFIPPHGGYQDLLSYQRSVVVYDATVVFCRDFLRTRRAQEWDKNSKEALFVRGLAMGRIRLKQGTNGTKATDARNVKAQDMSRVSHTSPVSYDTFRPFENRPPEIRANLIICLIHQTNYLLDQQLRKLEQDFMKEGGLRERMSCARIAVRDQQRRRML
ncbi:MAG: four helix bundle suffix domain-containing protein [Kiritimatiellae bacterium]|nr:four helix bundle suffix domain-containing protein [Kiritimatiellia bacterium]